MQNDWQLTLVPHFNDKGEDAGYHLTIHDHSDDHWVTLIASTAGDLCKLSGLLGRAHHLAYKLESLQDDASETRQEMIEII
jgi:hypothetical protein